MLDTNNTILLVVDMQVRLARVMDGQEALFANMERMIKGAQALELPILWTEQVPEKLGPTLPEFSEVLIDNSQPIAKSSFSCCGNETFMNALQATHRKQILLTGIEAHVCVYQTGLDLLNLGYDVHLIADAISSRTPANRNLAIERMQKAGATLSGTEMSLFELLGGAEHEAFRTVSKLVK